MFTLTEMCRAICLVLGLAPLYAQTCVPARSWPAGSVSGTLDSSSCLLPDGTPYAAYRLDLPARGAIQISLTAANASLILRDSTGAAIGSGAGIQQPVEAGSYTLLVNAPATVAGPTPYTVQSSFTAEPGMMCSGFPQAGLNQSIAGVLGASGCLAPDGTPYEAYLVTTLGAGTLTVSLSSSDFTTVLTVRDADGYAIATDPAQVLVSVDRDSSYEIVVASAGQSGSFQVSTSFVPDPSETCTALQTFTAPGTDNAAVTTDSCFAVPPGGNLVYYNYYSFTVPAAGLADVTASSSDFGVTLNLLDGAGYVLATDTLGAGPAESEIRLQLAPGDYTAQVISTVPAGGAYTFGYQFTPGAPQPCLMTAANLGAALAGSLSPSSCRTSLGLADLYSFTLPAAGMLNLTLTATGFNSLVAIRDAKDNLLVLNQDVGGLGVSQLSADLPAGTYTIAAAAAGGSGGYQLASQFTAHAIAPCASAQALSINGGYIQNLGPGSCRGANGQPVDFYQFTLPSDSVVAAFMTSSQVDGFLTLVDSSGNFLRSDNDSYFANDPMIVQFLPAGTYGLAARAAGSTTGGYYEVDLRTVAGPRPPFCAPAGNLALGGTIAGALTIASCQYIDGTFADLYQMALASDTTIDLRLNSSAFDAYLVVLDAKGNVVAADDNDGGGTNARVNQPIAAGTYYLVAKPFSSYTNVGAYTLSLAQSGAQ